MQGVRFIMYVCSCMNACMYASAGRSVNWSVCPPIFARLLVSVSVSVCACMRMLVCVCVSFLLLRIYICAACSTCTYVWICMHVYVRTCVRMHGALKRNVQRDSQHKHGMQVEECRLN